MVSVVIKANVLRKMNLARSHQFYRDLSLHGANGTPFVSVVKYTRFRKNILILLIFQHNYTIRANDIYHWLLFSTLSTAQVEADSPLTPNLSKQLKFMLKYLTAPNRWISALFFFQAYFLLSSLCSPSFLCFGRSIMYSKTLVVWHHSQFILVIKW